MTVKKPLDPREQSNRKLYRGIGDFLEQHALDPSPANYCLVHALMSDDSSPVAKMILAATSDGLRLTQRDADRIRHTAGVEGAADDATPSPDAEMIASARKTVDDFSVIIEQARASAQSYHQDLSHGASQLIGLDNNDPVISMVTSVTAVMLERTKSAEEQLQAAQDEAEGLRRRLAEAETEARSDALTKLPNRRAFEDRLEELLAAGGTLSIGICDIDRFKHINDSHGHNVGDRVLKIVGDVLHAHCGGHMVARIGGEEFAVLFDGLTPAEAGAILDNARETLSSRMLKVRETDAPIGVVTFSGGVALCDAASAEAPLKRADVLLYEAKNNGRNRIAVETKTRKAA